MKQVLVTGDELNYYSNKNSNNEIIFGNYNNKASFFMQRGIKNEKVVVRKKSNTGYGNN